MASIVVRLSVMFIFDQGSEGIEAGVGASCKLEAMSYGLSLTNKRLKLVHRIKIQYLSY